MEQTPIQKKIQGLINEFFKDIKSHFDGDELAYLTLQGKNELQIRDKFAWWLQKKLNEKSLFGLIKYGSGLEKYVVRREFSPENNASTKTKDEDNNKGVSKVDLAILEIDNGKDSYKVISMIEFKAYAFVNDEKWIYPAFNKDVKKMCDYAKDDNPDLYYIAIQTTQNHKSSNYPFKIAVNYKDILENDKTLICKGCDDNGVIGKINEQWYHFYNLPYPDKPFSESDGFKSEKYKYIRRVKFIEEDKPQFKGPIIQEIGSSFGYKLYCVPMIWGPVKHASLFFEDEDHIKNLKEQELQSKLE